MFYFRCSVSRLHCKARSHSTIFDVVPAFVKAVKAWCWLISFSCTHSGSVRLQFCHSCLYHDSESTSVLPSDASQPRIWPPLSLNIRILQNEFVPSHKHFISVYSETEISAVPSDHSMIKSDVNKYAKKMKCLNEILVCEQKRTADFFNGPCPHSTRSSADVLLW